MADVPRVIAIIGGGLAGASCALELRAQGFDGEVHMFCAEPCAPYERPPLSKAALDGTPATYVGGPQAMAQADIIRHPAAIVLDPTRRTVTDAAGRVVAFDAGLLATGRRARMLPRLSAAACPVLSLRTLDDAKRLSGAAKSDTHVLIVGAGLIGMEVAAHLAPQCARVMLVEATERPMARAVPAAISEFAADALRANGVDLRLATTIAAIDGQTLTFSDGMPCTPDLILCAIGSTPDVALARDAGLATDQGIIVDDRLRTSAPGILAAGDVVAMRLDGTFKRFENYQAAQLQGQLAAHNMLGTDQRWAEPEWFWSDQGNVRLEGVGRPTGDETTAATLSDGSLWVRVEECGGLVGAFGIGGRKALREVRRAQHQLQQPRSAGGRAVA